MYREDVIIPLVTNKDVLDCGGVDHWAMTMKQERGDWLHGTIAEHARSILGVDILEESVEKVNAQGRYRFIVGNVEELGFDQEFDVVVAGEIVEHIYNMGQFLDSAWRALRKDGVLIITTPGHHALAKVLYSALLNRESCHPEHTCYYSKQTLSYIVSKHGFSVREVHLLSRRAASPLVERIRNAVIRLRPSLAEQLVLVAQKGYTQSKYEGKW